MVANAVVLNGQGFGAQSAVLSYEPGNQLLGALDNFRGNNTWTGSVTLGSPAPAGAAETIRVESQSPGGVPNGVPTNLLIAGVVSGVTGNPTEFALTKVGPGRLILTNVNTYQGGTQVDEGYLNVEDSQALGLSQTGATSADLGGELGRGRGDDSDCQGECVHGR